MITPRREDDPVTGGLNLDDYDEELLEHTRKGWSLVSTVTTLVLYLCIFFLGHVMGRGSVDNIRQEERLAFMRYVENQANTYDWRDIEHGEHLNQFREYKGNPNR